MVQATDLQVFRAEEIVEFLIHQLTHGQYIFFLPVEPEPKNNNKNNLLHITYGGEWIFVLHKYE